jgi:hypothetical protein
MNPTAIEELVFRGVASAPLGKVLLSDLDQSEIKEATKGFFATLLVLLQSTPLRPKLGARTAFTIDSVNDLLKESGGALDPADRTRKVLVTLAHLIIAGRLFAERPSDPELLGKSIKSLPHLPNIPQAAECLLNAAYRCNDAAVKMAAGRYYLEILDAEFGTAVGYFSSATKINRSLVRPCDTLLEQFTKTRELFYLGGLKPYLDAWAEHKRTL